MSDEVWYLVLLAVVAAVVITVVALGFALVP